MGLANRFFVGADHRTDAPHSDGSVIGVGMITHGIHFLFVPFFVPETLTHSNENHPTVRLAAC